MSKFDPSGMRALVVDPNHQQRRLTQEQLRIMGFGAVAGVSSFDRAWEAMAAEAPHVVLVDWVEPREATLEFVRRTRHAPESPCPEVSLFILTSRGALIDVENAREAGVDGYLRKPISVNAIQDRVRHAFVRPKADPAEAEADRQGQRARAQAAALDTCARNLKPDDSKGLAQLAALAANLNTVAVEVGDSALGFGAQEFTRYLSCAETPDLDAMRTHTAALFQIALMPSAYAAERERLAGNLKRMVDKKLRQPSAA